MKTAGTRYDIIVRQKGKRALRFVIITGPSGAGKTQALHSFEDAGFFAADNLPPRLLAGLLDLCAEANHDRVAVVVDTRTGNAFAELPSVLEGLREAGNPAETLYLDASDEALLRRYKETRRPHPLLSEEDAGAGGGIFDAIERERELLQPIRAVADRILDTSTLTANQLRDAVQDFYAEDARPGLFVTIISFGFKHGLPVDADLVFDVRFLVNPHYVPELKPLSGRNPKVWEFVHRDPRTDEFLGKVFDLVRFALPQYEGEGKAYLNIAIGCTGGQHRSVALSEDLAAQLREEGWRVVVRHRDMHEETLPLPASERQPQ